MQKLSAERYKNGMYIEAAETPEKALEMIRSMLGLPETADAAGVVAELEKVKQWILSGASPLGVDSLHRRALLSTPPPVMQTALSARWSSIRARHC
jgi:hypothetical protein